MVHGRDELILGSATVRDTAIGYYVDGAAGFELYTPGRVSVGFSTDAGYAYRSPLHFDDAQPLERDGPSTEVDLGELTFRGFQWRGGFFLRTTF